MKKLLLLLVLILGSTQVIRAQAVIKYYGWDTLRSHYPSDLIETQDGGFIMIGDANSSAPLIENFYTRRYLVKTDANGDTLWTYCYKQPWYGGTTINENKNTGEIIGLGSIAGSFSCGLTGSGYPFTYYSVYQYSATGDSLSTGIYNDTCSNSLTDVGKNSDGSLYGVVSAYNPIIIGPTYFYSIKEVSPSGSITHIPIQVGAGEIEKADNGYWIAKWSMLYKVSPTGSTMWQNAMTFSGTIQDFCKTNDDSLLFVTGSSGYDTAYVVKTDSFGAVQWRKKYMFSVRDVMQHSTGKYVLTGHKNGELVVYVLDSNGDSLWSKSHPVTLAATGICSIETNGKLMTLGASGGYGVMDQYALVFDTLASALTGVEKLASYSIELNILPNPNTGTFRVEASEEALIEIYDIYGKRIFLEKVNMGFKELRIAPTPGIYLLRATFEKGTRTRRIVVQ